MPIWNGIIFDAEAYDLDEEDGVYYFDDIIGQVQPKQKIIDVTNRPGVPGETFRNMGEWPRSAAFPAWRGLGIRPYQTHPPAAAAAGGLRRGHPDRQPHHPADHRLGSDQHDGTAGGGAVSDDAGPQATL